MLLSPVSFPSVAPSKLPSSKHILALLPTSIPLVSIPAQMASIEPTKLPYIQKFRTTPCSPIVVPTPATTMQPTDCSPRVDPTPQSPTMSPNTQPPAHAPRVIMTPLRYTDPIYHRTCSRSPIPLDNGFTSWRTRSSQGFGNLASLPLPIVANYQHILLPSGPFLSTTPRQGKILSISNSATTLISRRNGNSITQTNCSVSARSLEKSPMAHHNMSKAPTPPTSYVT